MKVAVICGGAEGVWEQREQATIMVADAGYELVTIAVNEAGIEHSTPLHHWVSLHPDRFPVWERRRAELGRDTGYVKWTQTVHRHVRDQRLCEVRRWKDGSSGLTAVDVALNHAGCVGAILCGVPLDASVNIFRGKPWGQFKRYRHGFQKARPEIGDRLRSMAGWTREQFGFPTPEWLASPAGPR